MKIVTKKKRELKGIRNEKEIKGEGACEIRSAPFPCVSRKNKLVCCVLMVNRH